MAPTGVGLYVSAGSPWVAISRHRNGMICPVLGGLVVSTMSMLVRQGKGVDFPKPLDI